MPSTIFVNGSALYPLQTIVPIALRCEFNLFQGNGVAIM